jgi:hypothetical protein
MNIPKAGLVAVAVAPTNQQGQVPGRFQLTLPSWFAQCEGIEEHVARAFLPYHIFLLPSRHHGFFQATSMTVEKIDSHSKYSVKPRQRFPGFSSLKSVVPDHAADD